jgi:hypothetical protein
LPLLLFYFLRGMRILLTLHIRFAQVKGEESPRQALFFMAGLLVILSLFGNGLYLSRKFSGTPSERPKWMRAYDEYDELLKWSAANLQKSDVVVTQNPPLVHLLTGNKTTTFQDPAQNWANWNRLGVRYLVQLSPVRLGPPDTSENRYRLIHRTDGELNLRVVDLGLPSTRVYWGENAPTLPTYYLR